MDGNQDEKIRKSNEIVNIETKEAHCQHFVQRKKRYCRMTVRPGGQYCGEHEPQPEVERGDKRIPCPNDPKHTVYVSKLKKHLSICNARATDLPPYIVTDINSPPALDYDCPRVPLSQVPPKTLEQLIQKINHLYETHIKDNIKTLQERPIHPAVEADFNESLRTESSLRHLRQASRLMWLVEEEGLVKEGTCYIELGAGKGQLSYYMGVWWCNNTSRLLPVDRAALRHKRERRGRGRGSGAVREVRPGATCRVRGDLAHIALDKVGHTAPCAHVVGLAKHLCGAATDYAVRCVVGSSRARGLVVATCCHHRCDRLSYIANEHLQELGISGAEFNIMLSVVSWATCGDGRSRDYKNRIENESQTQNDEDQTNERVEIEAESRTGDEAKGRKTEAESTTDAKERMDTEERAEIGRRAKALLDWGRVLYLRGRGFQTSLARYVPTTVSLENICVIAKRNTV